MVILRPDEHHTPVLGMREEAILGMLESDIGDAERHEPVRLLQVQRTASKESELNEERHSSEGIRAFQ